jgi:hypothetical protein
MIICYSYNMLRLLVILLFVGHAHAQTPPRVPDLQVRHQLNLPEGITKTVQVTGHGESPALARQDAFKTAIERVAGIVIASETMSDRYRLTRDQIATYSQARISDFAIASMLKENGVWTCLVWVTVRSACTNTTYNCVN